MLLGAAVAVVACRSHAPAVPPSAPSDLLERPLPEIRGATLDSRRFDGSALTGKTVVVKFFAQYCEPCMQTLPAAQRLAKAYPDVRFVGVSLDESVRDAQALVERFGLTFPVVHDRAGVVRGRMRVTVIPATLVADAAGTVRWVGGPEQTEGQLRQAIEAVR